MGWETKDFWVFLELRIPCSQTLDACVDTITGIVMQRQ